MTIKRFLAFSKTICDIQIFTQKSLQKLINPCKISKNLELCEIKSTRKTFEKIKFTKSHPSLKFQRVSPRKLPDAKQYSYVLNKHSINQVMAKWNPRKVFDNIKFANSNPHQIRFFWTSKLIFALKFVQLGYRVSHTWKIIRCQTVQLIRHDLKKSINKTISFQ